MSCTSRLSSSSRRSIRRPSYYGVASASRVGWYWWALLLLLLLLLLDDPSARTPRTANGFVILPKDPRVSRRPHSSDARMDAVTTTRRLKPARTSCCRSSRAPRAACRRPGI